MPGDILGIGLGTKCRTVTDKNGTSYLTMTGKDKQTTLGDTVVVFFCCCFVLKC